MDSDDGFVDEESEVEAFEDSNEANSEDAGLVSIVPPIAPTPIRMISSLISRLLAMRVSRSLGIDRDLGTSTEARKNCELGSFDDSERSKFSIGGKDI